MSEVGMLREIRAIWLGRRRYEPVHQLQQRWLEARQQGLVGDAFFLLEHEPVITLGRGAKAENLLATPKMLSDRGIDLVTTGRGGDVTLHAPGQLVGYPILDLAPERRDVRRYVGDLARLMAMLLRGYGIAAGTVDGMVGVWVDSARCEHWEGVEGAQCPEKVGAIGVRISRWVTMHGFALNATTNLDLFRLIVPCGITAYGVTSIERLVGARPDLSAMARRASECFGEILGAKMLPLEDASTRPLEQLLPPVASTAQAPRVGASASSGEQRS